MSMLEGKRILIGVCGSIAAYKAVELVRLLRKAKAAVTVAMTRSATHFIGPATFDALTGQTTWVDLFDESSVGVPHVDIAEVFDAVVIAPATANMLGKAAHALADDVISLMLNIFEGPTLIVPAMNFRMWRNPATQDAVQRLRGWGREVMDPEAGPLATLHEGPGRLQEPQAIVERLETLLGDGPLKDQRILITAGPTQEAVDPVRYLSNSSSGKMGYALAEAARDMGAEVTLISGPVSLPPPSGVAFVSIETAEELLAAVKAQIENQDMLIMAAAVADFMPAEVAAEKIRRQAGLREIALKPAPDILKEVRKTFKGTLVAFSLQAAGNMKEGRKKLEEKQADWLVVNVYDEPGVGMGSDENHVWLLARDSAEAQEMGPAPKPVIARAILQIVH